MAEKTKEEENLSPKKQRFQQGKQTEKQIREFIRVEHEVKKPESKMVQLMSSSIEQSANKKNRQGVKIKPNRKKKKQDDKQPEEESVVKRVPLKEEKEPEKMVVQSPKDRKPKKEEPGPKAELSDKKGATKPIQQTPIQQTPERPRGSILKQTRNEPPEEAVASKPIQPIPVKKSVNKEEGEPRRSRDPTVVEVEPLVIIPPDGGWGWVIVAVSFFILVCCDGTLFSFGAYSLFLADDFGAPLATVSLVNSIATCLYYIMGPVWGALGNRYGFRKMSMLGAATMAAGYFAAYLITDSLIGFGAVYAITLGFGGGMLYMSVYVMVGIYFERWRGVAIAIISCGSSVGAVIMPITYNVIMENLPLWRSIFLFNGTLLSICVILAITLRPLKPTRLRTPRPEPTSTPKHPSKKERRKEGKHPKTAKGEGAKPVMASASFVTLKQAGATGSATSLFINADLESGASEPRIVVRPSSSVEEDAAEGVGARPMYREDIFYAASSARLDSQTGARISKYSVAALPTVEDVNEERRRRRCCQCCPPGVRRVLANFFDVSLFRSPVFLGILLSQTVCMLGYHTPLLYSLARADEEGMDASKRFWLLPTAGITNTVGRMLCGLVVEVPHISALQLTNVTFAIAGIFTICSGFSRDFSFQLAYMAVFGLTAAAFMAMKSIILVDYLGIEKLTNAFGLLLMFQGFASLVGPSISGYSAVGCNDLDVAFYISGSICVLGGLLGYLLYPLKKLEDKRKRNRRV